MNNVNLCDKALSDVMEAEAAAPQAANDNWKQDLSDRTQVHSDHYENVVIPAMFPQEHLLAAADHVSDKGYQVSTQAEHDAFMARRNHRLIDDDGTYHYVAMDDLPQVGRTDAPYKITSTGDLFKFVDGQYMAFNPYAPQGQQISAPRAEIVDDTANMPTGGTGPLSVIYNVHALRRDLHAKASLNWSFRDMVPQGIIARSDDVKTQRIKYFRHSHKALLNQIRTEVRKAGALVGEYVDALKRIGVDVWYDNSKNEFGFKDGEFVVVFA